MGLTPSALCRGGGGGGMGFAPFSAFWDDGRDPQCRPEGDPKESRRMTTTRSRTRRSGGVDLRPRKKKGKMKNSFKKTGKKKSFKREKRRKSSFDGMFQDARALLLGADSCAIKSQLSNHFTLTSRMGTIEFAHGRPYSEGSEGDAATPSHSPKHAPQSAFRFLPSMDNGPLVGNVTLLEPNNHASGREHRRRRGRNTWPFRRGSTAFRLMSRRGQRVFVGDGDIEFERRRRSRPLPGSISAVSESDFRISGVLGSGGFGAVFAATRTATGKTYALKVQPMEAMARSSRSPSSAKAGGSRDAPGSLSSVQDETLLHMERTVLASCRGHPFVVTLEYAFHTLRYAVLAMELVEGGTLSRLISCSPDRTLPFDLVKTYTMELLLALHYLHRKGVIYRDLKPSNILISRNGHLKLTDFGLAGSMVVKKAERAERRSKDDMSKIPMSPAFAVTAEARADGEKQCDDEPEPTATTGDPSSSATDSPEVSDQERRSGDFGGAARGVDSDDDDDAVRSGREHLRWVRRRTVCGTIGYRPPEQVRERFVTYSSRSGYDERVDWFALGVCVYTMAAGRKPFPTKRELQRSELSQRSGFSEQQQQQQQGDDGVAGAAQPAPPSPLDKTDDEATHRAMSDAEFRCLMFEVRYPPQRFDPELHARSFIEALLSRNPRERPRYKGIVDHPWISGEDLAEDAMLLRPIPQWVKDHAHLESIQATNLGHRAAGVSDDDLGDMESSSRNGLDAIVEDMCVDMQATQGAYNPRARSFVARWKTPPSKRTVDLFRHWNFMSNDAVRHEAEAARLGELEVARLS